MGEAKEGAPRDGGWRQRARGWAQAAALAVAAVVALHLLQTRGAASGAAPELPREAVDGSTLEPEGPALVRFVASWCGVCGAEEPNAARVAREHRVIEVVSRSGPAAAVRRWIASGGGLDPSSAVADPDGRIAARWGVRAFPTSFWIDARGTIRHVAVGYTTELGMRLRLWLAGG